MRFILDENLPIQVGDIFIRRGYTVEHVVENPHLRGKPDDVLFRYGQYPLILEPGLLRKRSQ